ncbi:MAG: CPBP family intramembrane glutamic endopeptidase [Sandaracinus sp.]
MTPPRTERAAAPSRSPRAPAREASAFRRALARLTTPYDPLTSLVLTIPVFLVYHLGILVVDLRNGADFVTGTVVSLLHTSLVGYVSLTLAVALALFAAGSRLRRGHEIDRRALFGVVVESTFWAGLMMIVVGGIVARVFHAQIGGLTLGPLSRVVMAAGAGFHEELFFRVVLFGGGAWLLRQATGSRTGAELVVAPIAATVFSAAHYVGPYGDGFTLASFVFRLLAGLWFTLVFRLRGFAVAVYTHALYDLFVFFAR